jgi:Amidohydrolase family
MTKLDLAIRGGTVVTASDTFRADVGVAAGRIVAVAAEIEGAAREIDASGLLVLPGGIDSHVHIAQPSGPDVVMADDFASATAAAAAGGNTCIMPFALQQRGTSLRRCVEDYVRQAEGECHIDVSVHLIISDPTPEVLGQELPALLKAGYTSFKVFMTYDDLVLNDRQLLDVFEVARRERALVMVHAEGYDAIRYMTDRLERAGQTAPFFHTASRPEVVEREAAHRAISHAELVDVPIMIVHVSSHEAMEQIRWAQQRGLKVYAETCSLPVPIPKQRRQADAQRQDVVSLGPQWHSRGRNAAAYPVFGRCFGGQNFAEQVCRVNFYQSRQDVRSLSPQRIDRHRLRRRYHLVGPAPSRDDPTGEPSSWLRLHAVGGLRSHRMACDDDSPGRGCRA